MVVETKKGKYVVYSSLDEFFADDNEADLITEVPYAVAGNYILSEQGYVVPIISRVNYAGSTYLQLPLLHININDYWTREQKGKPWYPLVVKNKEEVTFDSLKPEHKAIIQLVGNGVPLQKASMLVYGRNITLDIFGNELLVKYLGKHLNMSKWKEALEKHNINEDFVVDQLASMAGNEDIKAQQGRMYAIERLSALLGTKDNYGSGEVVDNKKPKGYFTPLSNQELPVYSVVSSTESHSSDLEDIETVELEEQDP